MHNKETFAKSPLGKAIKLYAGFDFLVFPTWGVDPQTLLCTCGDAKCNDSGKHPATRHGVKDAIHAAAFDEVAQLFKFDERLNIAVATGKISNCFVLDVDGEVGFQTLTQIILRHHFARVMIPHPAPKLCHRLPPLP